MAKPKPQFQEILPDKAFIDPVRTDIRIHCNSAPLLKRVIRTIDLNEQDFAQTFKTESEGDKKNKKKAKNQKEDVLKLMVCIYLNLLFSKAKLEEFKEELTLTQVDQEEIIRLKTTHPTVAQTYLNLAKKVAPESAVDFLKSLKQEVLKIHQDLVQASDRHATMTENYIQQYNLLLDEFDQKLKELHYTLGQEELRTVFKILGGIHS